MALRILLGSMTGNLTATSHALQTASGDSDLQHVSDLLRDALQSVFDWFAFWLNVEAPGNIETFSDFSIAPSPDVAKLMLELAQAGILSGKTIRQWLRNAGLLPSTFDEDTETFLIANDAFGDVEITTNAGDDDNVDNS